jgi:hypothetical protein
VAKKSSSGDIETLRIELRRVDEFVSTFEHYVEQFRGRVVVAATCQTEGGGPELLLLIRESLAEMAKVGFAKSTATSPMPGKLWGQITNRK